MAHTFGLAPSNIRYYTNIILSGSLAVAPYWWQLIIINPTESHMLYVPIFLSVIIIGRICLELALYVENHYVDSIVSCKMSRPNAYENFAEPGNIFNVNWYSYLQHDNNKAAYEIIGHMADRMLFFLSSSVGAILGTIGILTYYTLDKFTTFMILGIVVVYAVFSFIHATRLATGLDYLRYMIRTQQQNDADVNN